MSICKFSGKKLNYTHKLCTFHAQNLHETQKACIFATQNSRRSLKYNYSRIGLIGRLINYIKKTENVSLSNGGLHLRVTFAKRPADYKGSEHSNHIYSEFSSHHRCGFLCPHLNKIKRGVHIRCLKEASFSLTSSSVNWGNSSFNHATKACSAFARAIVCPIFKPLA